MFVILVGFLCFDMLFSVYFLFARPLNSFLNYMASNRGEYVASAIPTRIFVIVGLFIFTLGSSLILSLWAYVTHTGSSILALIAVGASIVRIAILLRDSQLRVRFIDGNMSLWFRGQWSFEKTRVNQIVGGLNLVAEVVVTTYLVHLVGVIFLG